MSENPAGGSQESDEERRLRFERHKVGPEEEARKASLPAEDRMETARDEAVPPAERAARP